MRTGLLGSGPEMYRNVDLIILKPNNLFASQLHLSTLFLETFAGLLVESKE